MYFFQAEDGIRDKLVTGVQTCALPISRAGAASAELRSRRRAGATVAGAQPVGLQAAPQRRAADTEPSCRLGEPAAGALQRVDDRLALPLRQRARLLRPRQEDHFPETRGTRAQR